MFQSQTLEKLKILKLNAMADALKHHSQSTVFKDLSFDEKLGLLVDQEITHRQDTQLQGRLRRAKLRHQASFENINFSKSRGLDKSAFLALASCQWIKEHLNMIITGPCGAGKSFLACAMGHKACLEGFKVLYFRTPRLLEELSIAHGDGSFSKRIQQIQKADLIILDDWGIKSLEEQNRQDLLEIAEDRYGQRSTIITSQLSLDQWHDVIGNPTLADAILDRFVHNAYKVQIDGDSMRKIRVQKEVKNKLDLNANIG